MRLLLIEDDRKAARLLAKGLQEEGFVVDVAPTGEDGEEKAAVNEYDLIVLDWVLPGKDGRSEEHTSELQSRVDIVCSLLLEKKNCVWGCRMITPHVMAVGLIDKRMVHVALLGGSFVERRW